MTADKLVRSLQFASRPEGTRDPRGRVRRQGTRIVANKPRVFRFVEEKVKKGLPQFLEKYFWDVEFKELDMEKSARFILKRILEYGDERAIVWMRKNFTEKDVEDILINLRISPRSANYWATIFGIDKRKVLCLQKPYLERRKRLWPY